MRSSWWQSSTSSTSGASRRPSAAAVWSAGSPAGRIDLRAATLHPDGAVLHTQAVFGGGSVIVPPDWVVTTNVVGIGGAGDARGVEAPQDGPRLTIEGMAVFGGWGILTSDPRVEAPATI